MMPDVCIACTPCSASTRSPRQAGSRSFGTIRMKRLLRKNDTQKRWMPVANSWLRRTVSMSSSIAGVAVAVTAMNGTCVSSACRSCALLVATSQFGLQEHAREGCIAAASKCLNSNSCMLCLLLLCNNIQLCIAHDGFCCTSMAVGQCNAECLIHTSVTCHERL